MGPWWVGEGSPATSVRNGLHTGSVLKSYQHPLPNVDGSGEKGEEVSCQENLSVPQGGYKAGVKDRKGQENTGTDKKQELTRKDMNKQQ